MPDRSDRPANTRRGQRTNGGGFELALAYATQALVTTPSQTDMARAGPAALHRLVKLGL